MTLKTPLWVNNQGMIVNLDGRPANSHEEICAIVNAHAGLVEALKRARGRIEWLTAYASDGDAEMALTDLEVINAALAAAERKEGA